MFDLPKEYGYVILVASSSALVATWHGINVFSPRTLLFAKCDGLIISLQVGKYRKAANVPYPNAYCSADEASKDFKKKQFNCAQRAHVRLFTSYPSAINPCLY